jgi:O-antigen ligase
VVRKMTGGKTMSLPAPLNLAWTGVLFCLVVSSALSDSIGYSISATLRWVMAYVIFVLFYSFSSDKKELRVYEWGFLWFGVIVALASFVSIVFSGMGQMLSGMNLLFPAYGHNHIVNILVFVFPLALHRLLERKNKINILLFCIFSFGIIFSFARGAWILVVLYLGYFLFTNRGLSIRMRGAILAVVVIVVAMFTLGLVTKALPSSVVVNKVFQRQIIKDSILDNRRSYWTQAITAIRERPLFGSGPGTFYLQSKRFQQTPNRYSWYAHSFPLELFAEAGVIGIFFLTFLGFTLRRILMFHETHSSWLRDGILLTLIYSVYEINLNFLVIWFLLWAALGMLYGERFRDTQSSPSRNYLLYVSLTTLIVFYLSSVAGALFGLISSVRPYALYAQPYSVDRVMSYLLNVKSLTKPTQKLIIFFHKRDPEVLLEMAKFFEKKDPYRFAELLEGAILADPLNMAQWELYMKVAQEKQSSMAQSAVSLYVSLFGTVLLRAPVPSVSKNESMALVDFLDNNFLPDRGDQRNNLVRMFYGLGLASLPKSPDRTKTWWMLARDSNPDWSFIHIELASLAQHVYGDSRAAGEYLDYCQKFSHASDHCRSIVLSYISDPGAYKDNMKAIPSSLR